MKRIAAFIFLTALPLAALSANWVEEWFDNSVSSPSGSFEGQKRGFYNAGGFSGRLNLATDSPITITPPRLGGGCGGIDVFLGGMSFLDEDYIVQKFQNILQAAPAVAFDMALKTMCKECSETITKLQAAADWLNNLQMNECAMSKTMVATVAQGDPNIMRPMWNEMTSGVSLSGSMSRSWQEVQEQNRANNFQPSVDLKSLTSQCPASFKLIFQNGSIVDNVSEQVGLGDIAPTIRGLIGDVFIRAGNADMIPASYEIMPCAQNVGATINDILDGHIFEQNTSQSCSKVSGLSIREAVTDRMVSITDSIVSNTQLTGDQVSFIDSSGHIPIYSILRKGIMQGNSDAQIAALQDVVGATYAMHIMSNLYSNITVATNYIQKHSNPIGSVSSGECDPRLYQGAISHLRSLNDRLRERAQVVREHYNLQMTAYAAALTASQAHRQDEASVRASTAMDVGR